MSADDRTERANRAYVLDCLSHGETPYAGWSSDFSDLLPYLEDVRDFCTKCLASITATDVQAGRCTNCGMELGSVKTGVRKRR